MINKPSNSSCQYPSHLQPLIELTGKGAEGDAWLLGAESSSKFLRRNPSANDVVIFASLPHVLIHGVLVPLKNLKYRTAGDLMENILSPGPSWQIAYERGGRHPERVFLDPPFGEHNGALHGGERLVCHRFWTKSDRDPLEISQKFVHAHDLHYVDERNAYCHINELGDIEEVVKVVDRISEGFDESIRIVTIRHTQLYEFALLSGMAIVYWFDFTRYWPGHFNGWNDEAGIQHREDDLAYDGGVQPGTGSYIEGRQIVQPQITHREILERHKAIHNPDQRDYAKFKAIDLKSKRRIEVSCSPECVSNYFEPESNLPLEMSPVFFRPEVLNRFKADPDKYILSSRSIRCQGAWRLKPYDVNEVGQVHTYLRYLRNLPYQEQLYWQSFNEWPKGPLSSRAIATDFHGAFSMEYDPVIEIKRKVNQIDNKSPDWWSPRTNELVRVVHHPVTGSESEWADAILALQQLVVEGFRHEPLKRMAIDFGDEPEKDWRSLKLLEVCLIGSGGDHEEVNRTMASLRGLQHFRTVTKAHGYPKKRAQEAKAAITEHGSLRAHFHSLAADCDSALDFVMSTLQNP